MTAKQSKPRPSKYKKRDPLDLPLSDKEIKFVEVYAKTGNRVTAYKEAGYLYVEGESSAKLAPSYCGIILKRPKIQRALSVLKSEKKAKQAAIDGFTVDYVRDEHMRFAAKCEKAGDMTNATRNLEALGRSVGAYGDNASRVDITVKREFTARERAEVDRIADILVEGKVVHALPGKLKYSAGVTQKPPSITNDDNRGSYGDEPLIGHHRDGDTAAPILKDETTQGPGKAIKPCEDASRTTNASKGTLGVPVVETSPYNAISPTSPYKTGPSVLEETGQKQRRDSFPPDRPQTPQPGPGA